MRSLLSASALLLALTLPTSALSTIILTNNGSTPAGWANDASLFEDQTLVMIWTITNDNPTQDQNITIVSAPHDLTFVFSSGDQLGDVPSIGTQGTTCVADLVLKNGDSCSIALTVTATNNIAEDGPSADWNLAAKNPGGSLILTVNGGGVSNFDFTMSGAVTVSDCKPKPGSSPSREPVACFAPEPSSIPLVGAALLGLLLIRRNAGGRYRLARRARKAWWARPQFYRHG